MTHTHREYGQMARKVAARHITRDDRDELTVELHQDFSARGNELVDATDFDLWMVHAWEDVPESGIIEYIGPDEALRRIAGWVEKDSDTYVALRYHHGEPDQGDFSLIAISAYMTGDTSDDENPESDDPIHMLTLYPKGTIGVPWE